MKFPNKYLRNLKPYKLASHKIWTVNPDERNNILNINISLYCLSKKINLVIIYIDALYNRILIILISNMIYYVRDHLS